VVSKGSAKHVQHVAVITLGLDIGQPGIGDLMVLQQGKQLDCFEGWLRSLDNKGGNGKDGRGIWHERRRWAHGGNVVNSLCSPVIMYPT